MDFIKGVMVVFAMLVPLIVLGLLLQHVATERKTDWKLATCLSALSVAISLVLLLGSERVSFLRYGDAVLQVNQKAEEVARLTEQNKRLANLTAKAVFALQHADIMSSGAIVSDDVPKFLEQLLKETGASKAEIDEVLRRTNSTR